MPGGAGRPSVSVVICCFTEARWELLLRGITSVQAQTFRPKQLVVVVDHNKGLYRGLSLYGRLTGALTGVEALENSGPPGLSGARNTGVEAATGDIVAFLDDDAEAAPDWLAKLVLPYDDPDVLAVGGRVEPVWESGRPAHFPEELDWIVGCTHKGLPRVAAQVRNVVGANMSFRSDVFERVGGFNASLGRQGDRPLGCEETELCLRASIGAPGTRVVYEPAAVVRHHVPATRGTLRYMLARAWSEGVSKAQVTRLLGRAEILGPERRYVRRVLPRAVLAGIRSYTHDGDAGGLARSGVIIAVLAVTAFGYLQSLWQPSLPQAHLSGSVLSYRRSFATTVEAGTVISQQIVTSPAVTFDVHGRVAIRVAPGTPGEAQLRDMLAPFLGPSASNLQLNISGSVTAVPAQSHAEDAYRYTDDSLFLPEDRVRVIRTESGFAVEGAGELLTAVVPLLDHLCIRQDTAMVHAAMVDYRGAGILLPAWGGVGKTSTVAKLLAMSGVGFMADDWGFITAEGTLLPYAKPMFIKPHHRPIYPDLFQGFRKPLAPGWLTSTVSSVATAVHPVIVRYPRTAAFTRRWSPEHRMVHPADVFGAGKIASKAPARLAIFLERFDGAEARLERRTEAWMAARIVGNFHSELPLVSRRLIEALGATGLVPLGEHFSVKTSVITRALGDVPCFVLRLPATWSADRTSDHVAGTVASMVDGQP